MRGTDPSPGPGPLARASLALALVTMLAFGVRAWQPDALGIGHYDEGVYAISARGVADPADRHLFPGQVRFSPPLWFTSVSVASELAGVPTATAALWLNVLVGTLTVLAAGAVGWAWFGPIAGVAGAVFLAGSQFQVMMARTALTDPTFTLLMLLAVAALGHGLTRGSLSWSAAGGVLTGLAWNTKYHGWFVPAIAAGAVVVWGWSHRREVAALPRIRRTAGLWLLASVIAAAMYVPWAVYMRSASGPSGWQGVFQYYLTMIGTEWPANAARHLAQQAFLEGPLSRGSALAAIGIAIWITSRPLATGKALVLAVGLAAVAWFAGAAGVAVLLTAAGARVILRDRPRLEALLLLGWVVLWLVAAPIYRPYARLLLPLGVVIAILAGVGLSGLIQRLVARPGDRCITPGIATAAILALALLLGFADWRLGGSSGNPWRDGTHTARAADSVASLVPEGAPIVVIGEPSLTYYLIELGRATREHPEPTAHLDTVSVETWVVTGVYTDRAPTLREARARLAPRLHEVARLSFVPSDLRLLDDMKPARAREYRRAPTAEFDFRLYRLGPPGEAVP